MSDIEKVRFCICRARRFYRKNEKKMAVFWMSAALGYLKRTGKP